MIIKKLRRCIIERIYNRNKIYVEKTCMDIENIIIAKGINKNMILTIGNIIFYDKIHYGRLIIYIYFTKKYASLYGINLDDEIDTCISKHFNIFELIRLFLVNELFLLGLTKNLQNTF